MLNSKSNLRADSIGKKDGRPIYLLPRDHKILQYIWTWKLASTASVHEVVGGSADSTYATFKVLEKLERNGFIEGRFVVSDRFHVWQLTNRGFQALCPYLGNLTGGGDFSDNPRHDRLIQAFQLGEWATHQLSQVRFFTGQELRRFESYPDWVPKVDGHRPDGYTQIFGPRRRPWSFAYQVELSPGSLDRYVTAVRFYQQVRGIDRVFWLVGRVSIKRRILAAKAFIKDKTDDYHVFVDLEEFLKSGWDAQVTNQRSENLFTLREIYQRTCGDAFVEILQSYKGKTHGSPHLNNSKVIGKPRGSSNGVQRLGTNQESLLAPGLPVFVRSPSEGKKAVA